MVRPMPRPVDWYGTGSTGLLGVVTGSGTLGSSPLVARSLSGESGELVFSTSSFCRRDWCAAYSGVPGMYRRAIAYCSSVVLCDRGGDELRTVRGTKRIGVRSCDADRGRIWFRGTSRTGVRSRDVDRRAVSRCMRGRDRSRDVGCMFLTVSMDCTTRCAAYCIAGLIVNGE